MKKVFLENGAKMELALRLSSLTWMPGVSDELGLEEIDDNFTLLVLLLLLLDFLLKPADHELGFPSHTDYELHRWKQVSEEAFQNP